MYQIDLENLHLKYTTMPTGKDGYRYFTRAAWAFGPCIASIPTLRPVITIDVFFLSGRYHGKLLMACGYDAENQLVSIVFGLVEKENFENWGRQLRLVCRLF